MHEHAIAARDPNIEVLMSVVGAGGSRITPNNGILLLRRLNSRRRHAENG